MRDSERQATIRVPVDREDPFHPPGAYRELRDNNPVVRARARDDGPVVWLVTKYSDVRAVLDDTRFSSDSTREGYPAARSPSKLIRMDPPDHTYYRRILSPEFIGRRIEALRPDVERITEELLDEIVGGEPPADLMPTLAMPLPSIVICRLLGIQEGDSAYLQECAAAALRTEAGPEAVDKAIGDLGRYMDEVARRRLANPGDDMFSRLVTDYVRTGSWSFETAADIGRLIFVAGHVTTVHMIGLSILVLLNNPRQLSAMQENDALVAPAVNELLRHLTIVRSLNRVATVDMELGGVQIRAGDGVVVSLSSANRDERAFSEPDRLDIHRSDGAHVAFGYGPHLCLGAALARMELRVVLSSVFRRLPGLRTAKDLGDIPFRTRMTFYGVNELLVTWDQK